MKKLSLLVALLSLFSKPTKTIDTPTFLAGATIAIALALYVNTPYSCPTCNKQIKEGKDGDTFVVRPGCQHRYHTNCLNMQVACQRCLREKVYQKRQEAKIQAKKEEAIRKNEREKMEQELIQKRKDEELQKYITQKQREEEERKEREEKLAQQQVAFQAQLHQERENQKLAFEREQDVIRLIDWMMVLCPLCSLPLAQKDPNTEILLDLRKYPKHYITLPCSQKDEPHRFHRACLNKWRELHTVCPIPSCGGAL